MAAVAAEGAEEKQYVWRKSLVWVIRLETKENVALYHGFAWIFAGRMGWKKNFEGRTRCAHHKDTLIICIV